MFTRPRRLPPGSAFRERPSGPGFIMANSVHTVTERNIESPKTTGKSFVITATGPEDATNESNIQHNVTINEHSEDQTSSCLPQGHHRLLRQHMHIRRG